MQEVSVVIVDRRIPRLREEMQIVTETFLHDKMVHKPTHRVGVLVCGSDGTKNKPSYITDSLNCEGINEAVGVSCVDLEHFEQVAVAMSQEAWSNEGNLNPALIRASGMIDTECDSMGKKKSSIKKRIVLLTDVDGLKDAWDEHSEKVFQQLKSLGIRVCVFCYCTSDKNFNTMNSDWLQWTIDAPWVEVDLLRTPYEMKTCLPVKEVRDAHVIYSHTLSIGSYDIAVKMVPKIKREIFPALGNINTGVEFDVDENVAHNPETKKHLDYYVEDDIEQSRPVDEKERVKAFRVRGICL